jgi:hypothetical protein
VYVTLRCVLVELFKLYKTVTCVAARNLLWEDVSALIRPEDQIYRYGLVGLEIFGLAIMILAVKYIKKTIEVFKLSEFDLIRENFTTDFYKKVNETREY